MAEKVLKQIYAGSHPVYEIVEDTDPIARLKGKVTLRVVDEPSIKIDLLKGTIGLIGNALIEIGNEEP